MRVRALRGVCIGPGRHLKPEGPDREGDVDASTATFLVNIGAVEIVPDPPAPSPEVSTGPTDFATTAAAKVGKKEKQHAE